MSLKQHGRQYDLIVFGATGYTGTFVAEHITTHLPTNLKWAVAGRSESKLQHLVGECKKLSPDRVQPGIEICSLNDEDLEALAKKTYILITTVGPYAQYGEHAFRACAENGTHYLDVTGETPWTGTMIKKYEGLAQETGAMMFPQIGIESAPPDLVTWVLAKQVRERLSAQTGAVTVSIHQLDAAPSGGTLATVLGLFDSFTLSQVREQHKPYALSPVPNRSKGQSQTSLLTKLVGLRNVPNLGLMTTSIAGMTDTPIVQRTWGLFATLPSREKQFYGPNFSFHEYMRAKGYLRGIAIHWALAFFGLLLATAAPFRKLVRMFVYQPGEGPDKEACKKDEIEYRGTAIPDRGSETGYPQAFCRAWYNGSMYYLTAVLLAQAASTLLEEDVDLPGGVFTPSCLGQPFIDRLQGAGFKFESEILEK
ncbi:Saccharopine dehydrogenase [Colletotrichum higginsianum IMI 349063]|uniref:Saccharopine dehydrogenase n=2 Tax=Colletotrichum higginsianum TaxID=80884 RepID=A0A1B7YQU2_COLHI|nr:Saccharopine dehydrogenase [Colletotrichum higginsianum IMI 349063]OBR14322.1 Saccharopine dehydrogenase [Colletotrichum higginsianum IMI 349063]TID01533.1 Saccharopine dehydrogenase-like oxidoreductase [Colletotrichum higginsianum]